MISLDFCKFANSLTFGYNSHNFFIMPLSPARELLSSVRSRLSETIIGQSGLIDAMLLTFASGGHLLLEGPPGVGKTLGAQTLAHTLGLSHQRISFTADLMPSDLVGSEWYHPAKGTFQIRKGPLHTHILVADEINRAPARVQSALLEAMNESRVTIGAETFDLPMPFMVIATQNALDHEGTYALPEAELDRFLASYSVPYPSAEDEARMVEMPSTASRPIKADKDLASVAITIREGVLVAPEIIHYAVAIVRKTREGDLAKWLRWGVSPRASIALVSLARSYAVMQGRDFVLPDDVRAILPLALTHRLALRYEAQSEGVTREWILARLLESGWWERSQDKK